MHTGTAALGLDNGKPLAFEVPGEIELRPTCDREFRDAVAGIDDQPIAAGLLLDQDADEAMTKTLLQQPRERMDAFRLEDDERLQ